MRKTRVLAELTIEGGRGGSGGDGGSGRRRRISHLDVLSRHVRLSPSGFAVLGYWKLEKNEETKRTGTVGGAPSNLCRIE